MTWLQHCSNIATLCCAKNRRCESSLYNIIFSITRFYILLEQTLKYYIESFALALAKSIYYFSVAAGSRHL